MLKRLGMLLGMAAIGALTWFLVQKVFLEQDSRTQRETSANATNAESFPEEETLNLALKTITLSQGEDGFEIWRLKAKWANVMKEGDAIFVEKPQLTYFSKDGDLPVHVSSEKGNIEQKKQILRFIADVRVSQDDKRLNGELLVYNGTRKTMTFPHGGVFASADMAGKANCLEWDMDQKTIVGTGDVSVDIQSVKQLPHAQQE